jgi:hypothetical protein
MLNRCSIALQTLLCVTIAFAAVGCSEPKFYPARGKVVVFGVGPLKEGEIRFRPKSRPNLVATGKIQKDGTFSVSTPGHGEGVLEGDCQAAIFVEVVNGKRPIAERFSDFATADLNCTIRPGTENYFQLDVKKPGN